MDNQRLLIFLIMSFAFLMAWDYLHRDDKPVQPAATSSSVPSPTVAVPPNAATPSKSHSDGLSPSQQRVRVTTDLVYAEIDTAGGDLRLMELTKHRESHDKNKRFVLFTDHKPTVYVAQSGLIGEGLPTHKSQFTSGPQTSYTLAPGATSLNVKLYWQGNGISVVKTYTFSRNSYVVNVSFDIQNNTPQKLTPSAYYQFLHDGKKSGDESALLHTFTGAAVYTEQNKFEKIDFEDIDKGKAKYPSQTKDGWIGLVQHYFLGAWLPANGTPREFYTRSVADALYAIGVIVPAGSVATNSVSRVSVPLYAGPQEQDHLSAVAPGLELAVDYGWLTVVAAPLFEVLQFIYKWVGNWGVAIIILTLLIKLIFYPLSAKSYQSMAHMRVIAPKLQKLKEQYGNDRQRLHQAMMEMYKKEKINPLGGCLPILIQIPVFIALYWVLLGSVEMRHAPFFGWIQDLSAPDPYYILPILMGITMIIQTRLNPPPPDPIQAKVMKIMPIAFSVFFFFFPAGLVLYWLINNILSIAQQWYITRSIEQAAASGKKHA